MVFLPWDPSHRADPHSFWNRWRDTHGTHTAIGPQTGRTFHLAFGSGIHRCLGAPLARREARIAFESLNATVGRLELAVDRDDLAWTPDNFLRGAVAVPVRRA